VAKQKSQRSDVISSDRALATSYRLSIVTMSLSIVTMSPSAAVWPQFSMESLKL